MWIDIRHDKIKRKEVDKRKMTRQPQLLTQWLENDTDRNHDLKKLGKERIEENDYYKQGGRAYLRSATRKS